MHAMSHRSDFFVACSSRVNSYEPAFYFAITLLLTDSQVELPTVQIPAVILDLKCLNIPLVQVVICSKNECVFVCDLSNLN